jgi:hypothetical protein
LGTLISQLKIAFVSIAKALCPKAKLKQKAETQLVAKTFMTNPPGEKRWPKPTHSS